jgi:nucleotide-binding universal stress UspA family protein
MVGVDGSTNSAVAATWAVEIGGRLEAPVEAVSAWTEVPPSYADGVGDDIASVNAHIAEIMSEALEGVGLDGIKVTAARGPIAEVLLNIADEREALMLVVGTRGLGAVSGLLLGSISRRLLFATDRPLVVVPSTVHPVPRELTRVLVGVDCSPVAPRVLSWSARFCADMGLPATILRCVSPGCERPPGLVESIDDRIRVDTEEALRDFRDLGVGYTITVGHGDPRVAWVDNAASDRAGLMVIGSRGEGQFSGLGGTASYLVRHSPVPLAVIP